MGQIFAELLAFTVLGIILALLRVVFEAIKKAVTGTSLNRGQQDELEKFRQEQTKNQD